MRQPSRAASLTRWCGRALAGLVLATGVASCSATTDTQVQTVTVHEAAAKHPKPHPSAPHGRARRQQPEFVDCDANIEAKASTTTCPFAQNVFWTYFTEDQTPSIEVYSPKLEATLSTTCIATAGRVRCTTDDGGVVRFSQAAVDSYSQDQADAYADNHDLGPDPAVHEDSPPAQDSSDDGAEPDPPPVDEEPGQNIPNYDEGRGYRVRCADGMYSKSGGISGACSGHGGVDE